MCGDGKRFSKDGELYKPLIKVEEKCIIEWTLESLGSDFTRKNLINFIIRSEHQTKFLVEEKLNILFPNVKVTQLPHKTQGNLDTVLQFVRGLSCDDEDLLVLDSDNAYDGLSLLTVIHEYKQKLENFGLTCCFEPIDNSAKWCFCVSEQGRAIRIMEKDASALGIGGKPMLGVFYFSKVKMFKEFAESILLGYDKVNGEFYMSEVLKQMVNKNIPVFCKNVFNPILLGTPEDVERFLNEIRY